MQYDFQMVSWACNQVIVDDHLGSPERNLLWKFKHPRMHPLCHRLAAKCWDIKKNYWKLVLRQANFYLEMAMGTNLLGLAIPNLCPWKQPKPIFFKKHTHDGHKILPKPEPVRLTGYSRVTRARQQPYIVAPLPCWQLVYGQCIHVLCMMNPWFNLSIQQRQV